MKLSKISFLEWAAMYSPLLKVLLPFRAASHFVNDLLITVSQVKVPILINPRRACAARATVLGSVCLSVKSHLTSRMSNRAINERGYLVAYERQKICGDLP